MSVLMPPDISQTGKLLKIRVYEVDELPEMDEGELHRLATLRGLGRLPGCKGRPLRQGAVCRPHSEDSPQEGSIRGHPRGDAAAGHGTSHGRQDSVLYLRLVSADPSQLLTPLTHTAGCRDQAGGDDRIKTELFDYNEIKTSGFPPKVCSEPLVLQLGN